MQETLYTIAVEGADSAAGQAQSWTFEWPAFWDKVIEYGTNIAVALAVFIIGMMIVKRIAKMISKLLKKKDYDASLQGFLVAAICWLLLSGVCVVN